VSVIKDIPIKMPETMKKPENQAGRETNVVTNNFSHNSGELSDEDMCKICFAKKRTHGFVHAIQPSKGQKLFFPDVILFNPE